MCYVRGDSNINATVVDVVNMLRTRYSPISPIHNDTLDESFHNPKSTRAVHY